MNQFVKLNDAGDRLRSTVKDWSQVLDEETRIAWAADPFADELQWKAAIKRAAAFALGGLKGWHCPSIREALSMVDYSTFNPAFDKRFFRGPSGLYWTSTPLASAPRASAHLVHFSHGLAGHGPRSYPAWVRPCRSVSAARQ
jgi:hypothetical protein